MQFLQILTVINISVLLGFSVHTRSPYSQNSYMFIIITNSVMKNPLKCVFVEQLSNETLPGSLMVMSLSVKIRTQGVSLSRIF